MARNKFICQNVAGVFLRWIIYRNMFYGGQELTSSGRLINCIQKAHNQLLFLKVKAISNTTKLHLYILYIVCVIFNVIYLYLSKINVHSW